jgi:hypothetical protein
MSGPGICPGCGILLAKNIEKHIEKQVPAHLAPAHPAIELLGILLWNLIGFFKSSSGLG